MADSPLPMMGFSTTAIKVSTSDGHNVVVLEPFTFTDCQGIVYTIPAGTTSDGASTPRVGWIELPPFGSYWLACVFHDWLFRDSDLPEQRCNELLLEAMESLNVPLNQREEIFLGVTVGGWKSFEDDRRNRPNAPQPATPIST